MLRPMQDAHDEDAASLPTVEDQIVANRKAAKPSPQLLARRADAWHVGELAHRLMELLHQPVSGIKIVGCDVVVDLGDVARGLPTEAIRLGSRRFPSTATIARSQVREKLFAVDDIASIDLFNADCQLLLELFERKAAQLVLLLQQQ
jgi:hypothetical protein